ncbi:hypothetical protein [Fulvimarina sp. MAC8]|uniref:hypothetical protein n=1 Tax=Fulvimarina sp. MAC8 TaxID=3162874 RepID=UPI0032EF4EBB
MATAIVRPAKPYRGIGVFFSLLALVLLHVPVSARAAAWLQDEGDGQAIVTGLFSHADEAFTQRYDETEPVDFQKGGGSLLLDYGLFTWLTVTGGLEFSSETSDDLPYKRPGLSRASLGLRTQLYRSDTYAMSAEVGVLTEDVYGEADALVDTYGWDSPLLEARWSGGVNFELWGKPGFSDVSFGYRYRLGDGPDEMVIDTTLGYRVFEKIMILAQSFATASASSDEASYGHQKAQGSLVYDLSDRWSVQAGGFATVVGHNALKERGAFSALWYRF